jgi:hypothetical protein
VKLDKENDNTLWQYVVRKEIKNVRIVFKILNGEESVPPTYQETRCHMIFDVKMEDFRQKARFLAGGQDGRFQAEGKVSCWWARLILKMHI